MSFVSYFMLFQIVNMPQVISPLLLLLNLIYFLWNAYRHILMFWGSVTFVCAPPPPHLGMDQTELVCENWHLWDLMQKVSKPTWPYWEMPSHCSIDWMWATVRVMNRLWFFDAVDEHFLKNNFLLWNNVRFIEKWPREYREFPYTVHPVVSIANILQYHSTFIKTNKPTLLQYY